nr:integrase, catalytic core [Tanacetum cinerariifolium]
MRTNAMEVSTSQLGRNQRDQRQNMQFTRVTKIEFPKFGGDDVKGWMYKCEQFFKFMRLLGSDVVPWSVYRGAIMQRFGNSFNDPLGELKNCKFENSIEDYHNSFDKLLSKVDIREDRAISFYMAGLPTDIELVVMIFKPQTLSIAYSLSKLQVETNEATKKKNKAPLFPTPKFNNYTGGGSQISSPKPLALPAPNANWRNKTTIPQIVPMRKRSQVLYWSSLFARSVFDEEELQKEEEIVFGNQDETSQLNQILAEGPQISLHVLNGIQSYQTLRVVGMVGKIQIHILIDTGSTHNFIDTNVAKNVGCQLQLPDFNEVFIIETDASGVGIGALLQQKGHPIAFLSKTLAPKHQVLSTYETEFLAVIQALEKWRGYLLDRHFIIKTDHYNLKYLLDQRIASPAQMKWLPKLMGVDYEIVYKKGAKNVVADALSRVQGQTKFLQIEVTTLSSELYEKIQQGWNEDSQLKARIEKLNDETLRSELLRHFYSGPTGGHSGMQATIKRMGSLVYWKRFATTTTNTYNEWTEISMDCLCLKEGQSLWSLLHGLPKIINIGIILPTQVVYGQAPPGHITYTKGDNLVDDVDRSLSAREAAIIDLLKFHIKRSQDRMKSLADKHIRDREFEEGVWVYLKLQPYRQATLRQGKQNKLSPKYFEPFIIVKKVGKVAYKFQLPSTSQIHQVFHVSQLKLYRGPIPKSSSQLPTVSSDGLISEEPFTVLDRRIDRRGNVVVVYVLIQWVNGYGKLVTERFPHFDLDA